MGYKIDSFLPLPTPHQNGDLHVSVRTINLLLGTHLRDLLVYPQDVTAERMLDRSLPADQQLEEAMEAGEALAIVRWLERSYSGLS